MKRAVASALCLLAGCESLVDLDGLSGGPTDASAGASGMAQAGSGGSAAEAGASGSGALGGSGGGALDASSDAHDASDAGGVPAPDWTAAMFAVYRFDLAGANLGRDSGPSALDLFTVGTPSSATDAMQGAGSVSLGLGRFTHPGSTFQTTGADRSVTFGGWFKADADGEIVGHWDGDDGYRLERFGGALRCAVGDNGFYFALTSPASFPTGAWVHAVCQFDDTANQIETFIGGVATQIEPDVFVMSAAGDSDFRIGSESVPYTGLADEVFVIKGRPEAGAIRRIWACGIDGELCRCQIYDPKSYESCGRADPVCTALPDCDQAAP